MCVYSFRAPYISTVSCVKLTWQIVLFYARVISGWCCFIFLDDSLFWNNCARGILYANSVPLLSLVYAIVAIVALGLGFIKNCFIGIVKHIIIYIYMCGKAIMNHHESAIRWWFTQRWISGSGIHRSPIRSGIALSRVAWLALFRSFSVLAAANTMRKAVISLWISIGELTIQVRIYPWMLV